MKNNMEPTIYNSVIKNVTFGENVKVVMPSNIYGSENDNYDLESSHVLAAFLRKFHDAKINNSKEIVLWGSGTPMREFIHVQDVADACIFLMNNYEGNTPINVGIGEDISIIELAEMVSKIVGYEGKIIWDRSKPDGTPRKLLDTSLMESLGWKYKIKLQDGITQTYHQLIKYDAHFSNFFK